MKGVTYNYLLLVPAVIVVTASHTIIGIWLSYHAKSFSSLLVNYIIYIFAFLLPTVMAMLGIIGEAAARFLIVLPPDTAHILIGAMVREVEPWRLVFGYAYLILLSVVLYRYIIKPRFGGYVMREVGV
jgi:fluoroquinolone transport system permease protein